MPPAQRRLVAQAATNARWSRLTPEQKRLATERMRAGFLERFADEVDPDHLLPPEQREAMAKQARRSYMQALTLKRLRRREREKKAAAKAEAKAAAERAGGAS